MKTRHYASAGCFTLGHKETAADGPLQWARDKPYQKILTAHGPSVRARHPREDRCQKEDGFGMSGSDVAACFIDTFLGLVAAALLIAVLG